MPRSIDPLRRKQLLWAMFYLLLPFLVIGVVSLISLFLLDRRDGSGITASNAATIVKGMSREEVIGILGCEPGWYRGPDHRGGRVYFSMSHRRIPELWMNSTNGISVVIYFGGTYVDAVHVLHSKPDLNPEPKKWPIELSNLPY